jgi:hypothetical protein
MNVSKIFCGINSERGRRTKGQTRSRWATQVILLKTGVKCGLRKKCGTIEIFGYFSSIEPPFCGNNNNRKDRKSMSH